MSDESYKNQELKKINNIKELKNEIARQLYKGIKTEEDLKKAIPGASYNELSTALANMLKLKLIKKEGYPVKYSISDDIVKKLEQRKEISESDKNAIRVSIIIESKSDNKGKLREAMEGILNSLRNDERYVIYESTLADIIVHDDLFSTYIDAEVSCGNLNALLRLIYFYGVTTIDVIKPEKLQVPISDLQESLFTVVDMTHGYADMIFQLKKQNAQLSKNASK
jgi:hypothetical protein